MIKTINIIEYKGTVAKDFVRDINNKTYSTILAKFAHPLEKVNFH